MAAGTITNFNHQAAVQQVQIDRVRRAQQIQQRMLAPTDQAPSSEGMTRGQLRNNWYDAVGSTSAPAGPGYADYQGAFGKTPFIQDFKAPAAQDMMASAGMRISQSGLPGSADLSDAMLRSRLDGMSPESVKDLQKFLSSQGFEVGRAGCDGKLGPDTHKALMQFMESTQHSTTTYSPGMRKNYLPALSTQSLYC